MELAVKDALYILVLAVGVASSHFMLRAKVMVLEERLRSYSSRLKHIEDMLARIEEKLDHKADR